ESRDRAIPAQEGCRGPCRQDRRQGCRLRRCAEVGGERGMMVERVALKATQAEPGEAGSALLLTAGTTATPPPKRPSLLVRPGRWLWHHRLQMRALVIGALSLLIFLTVWHFLTKYRVNIYIRFLNVPSPEQVLERAIRAANDPKFLDHVLLSCRRILTGF